MTEDIQNENDESTKTCRVCGEAKPLLEFYARKEAKDGRRSECAECTKEIVRLRRKNNPERAKEIDRRSRENNRESKRLSDKRWRANNRERCAENSRRWKKDNPDKVRAGNARYVEKNREKINEKARIYNKEHKEQRAEWQRQDRNKNPEKYRRRVRAYRERNKDSINERNRLYMNERYATDPEYRELCKEQSLEYGKIWRQENKDKVRAYVLARRGRLAGAEGHHTPEDIRRINETQNFECVYCGASTEEDFHVDHKTPLSRGGSNWPDNLQILCPPCNVSKWARTDEEYREWVGKLVPANDNKKSDEEAA